MAAKLTDSMNDQRYYNIKTMQAFCQRQNQLTS